LPECFQSYFEDILEKLNTSNKPIYILGDFNINLLRFETCKYAHNFLISLQSYGFSPTIDKPTRVHNNSATLIDNILIRNDSNFVISGNIVSDISDHYSQFCIIPSFKYKPTDNVSFNNKIRDFSHFSLTSFKNDLLGIDFDSLYRETRNDIDKMFSSFYNKTNKIINKMHH
jgi:hypothetical protein